MQRRPFWFSRSLFQAMVETLLLGGGIKLGLIALQLDTADQYLNLGCLLWFTLRLTPSPRFFSKDTLKQIFYLLIPITLYTLYAIYMIGVLHIPIHIDKAFRLYAIGVLHIPIYIDSNFGLLANFFWLFLAIGIIGTIHLLRFWNRCREQSLMWDLMHAHILVILIVILMIPITGIRMDNLPSTLPILLFFLFGAVVLILVLMPPLALFAYFATRRTVKRIKALVTVTNDLRRGHYATRAPIEGKDEVAQLQENLNAMAHQLEKTICNLQTERDHVAFLLNERREFFATVSHELRTPIATLRGYLESDLKDRSQVPPPTIWEDLEVMEREVWQLQERADELFTLANAEVGHVAIQSAPCNVYQLVQVLVNSYAPLAWRTGKVEVVADIPDEVPTVNADEQRLEQALKNIVRNALRHTSPGGVIALVVTVEPERVGISVEDTGEGIAPEELNHIWERFYQSHASKRQGGAGIGLSLVKDWIEAMGGSVAVTSTLGDGSCFTLYLPRLHSEQTV